MTTQSNVLLLCLIALSFQVLTAQNQASDLSLTLNLTYLHDPTDIIIEGPLNADNRRRNVLIDNRSAIFLGFGLVKEKDNNTYQEISLLGLSFQADDEMYTIESTNQSVVDVVHGRQKNHFNLFMRFAVGKNIATNKKVQAGIAAGIEPHIFHSTLSPFTSASFPLNFWRVGGNIMLIPKVSIQLNDRLSLFSKIPFGVAAISWDRIRIHRPDLPQEKQTINNTSFEVGLSRLQLNLGLSVDI
jgi:hypothetical protein